MRVSVKDTSKLLPSHTLEIEDWFCRKEGLDFKECVIERETEMAYLFKLDEREQWVPKSLCSIVELDATDFDRF
ncbi:hypothetical protein [Methanosalsum natronophilum]|uniref:hypothetical protein n=1 Tax=Methanosalsum natronophilum TaxID=768733 RepID=UPI002168A315|nr:hypothetical protein [Methanosalsum natronophilum]MCS3923876.1 hypothetical protein [Methanosalsum natronophilum]